MSSPLPTPIDRSRAALHEGWVIANHVLVSFHVAFISSVLALPPDAQSKAEVLKFVFFSPETLVSAAFLYVSFHLGVALHELGHFLAAARLNALDDRILTAVQARLRAPWPRRALYLAKQILLAPYGRAEGIRREGLNYYPDAPYNLAVAAAGPRASRNVACATLPVAAALLATGLLAPATAAVYAGRLLLGVGVVSLLDFLLADPGKYREFEERERRARETRERVVATGGWTEHAGAVRKRLQTARMHVEVHPRLGPVAAPWQFRNCGMGGRHTEKEYPESNISMQEAMFLVLGARDYVEAQEMTVRLQTRLKEIIETAPGCRVMGIGLEGGLAPYVDRGDHPLPEVRLWTMMKQAIEECGYRPGEDVAIALDPAMSELENAYREEFDVPDAKGSYLFWRDKTKTVLDRDAVLALYAEAMQRYELPIVSIEDAFAEDDDEGWRALLAAQGDRILVIGDDLVTTNDRTIERAADEGLTNTALIKANQIGTLLETLLAVLVALGKDQQIVVSHRSKSPNDDMEAHLALALNALGLKAGGGSNTERLVKYQAVAEQMRRVADPELAAPPGAAEGARPRAVVHRLWAAEEPTNAGIPTVGATMQVRDGSGGPPLEFRGATPLGTSAGTGEAVHLVDSFFEVAEHAEVIEPHRSLFEEVEPGVVRFRAEVTRDRVEAAEDAALEELWRRAGRYGGKGCLTAAENVATLIAPRIVGLDLAELSMAEIDRLLLQIERETAVRRGKLSADADPEQATAVMQRKQNVGMNAILAVSLAAARACAHARGLPLWALLREHAFAIVEDLAQREGVAIQGSTVGDYVAALQAAARRVAARGESLHAELRRISKVYEPPEVSAPPPTRSAVREVPPPAAPAPARPQPVARTVPPQRPPISSKTEHRLLDLSRTLARAVLGDREEALRRALRDYVRLREEMLDDLHVCPFELVGNRVLRDETHVLLPYLVGPTLILHHVDGEEVVQRVRPVREGAILTDASIRAISEFEGAVVDLEHYVFGFDADRPPEVALHRVRDMAALLEQLDTSANYYETSYYVRCLVVRLCSGDFRGFAAKNLQPEVSRLREQLVRTLNGPFARRLRLPLRILVRNVSGLVLRPHLIDQVWNDAIDLAEVHVRGSSIANEIRRSCHHALGRRSLELARAYLAWLQTGRAEALAELGLDRLGEADETARSSPAAHRTVARMVENLEKLLGTSEIVTRLRDWASSYREGALRCAFGRSIAEEAEQLIHQGIRARNRWTFRHHVRILLGKAAEASHAPTLRELARELETLADLDPGSTDFDAESTEREAERLADRLGAALLDASVRPLEPLLTEALARFEEGRHEAAIEHATALRDVAARQAERPVFAEQRYMLYQLDGLLEELSYLALRHLAPEGDEAAPDLLPLLRETVRRLELTGIRSRELLELGELAAAPHRTPEERAGALAELQRAYHKVLQRVVEPHERIAGCLGLDERRTRTMLANLHRYLHDLNGIAWIVDLERSRLERPRGGESEIQRPPLDPLRFAHLSHLEHDAAWLREGGVALRERYGAKGAGLLALRDVGLPTRDGFVVPTDLAKSGLLQEDPDRVARAIEEHLELLERDLAARNGVPARVGDASHPLLVAVRGGSVVSMPGMLSTIVFLGMNDEIAAALARDDPWHAYDSYRRFLASFAGPVWGEDLEALDLVEDAKRRHGVPRKQDLPWQALREIAEQYIEELRRRGHGEELDQALADPRRQVFLAVRKVVDSWNSPRARRYRELRGIPHTWQTAVVIQQMSCGNRSNPPIEPGMDETKCSLTGVVPRTTVTPVGLRRLEGDIKFSAVGDDLVGGLTPAESLEPISRLREVAPSLLRRIEHAATRTRMEMGTDTELEFTVERGVLSILQVRRAEATVDHEILSFEAPGEPLTRGLGIRGSAFRGRVALDETDIDRLRAELGDEADGVVLVVENPTPDEIPAILRADALLTARGGTTSHAAVVVHGIEDRRYTAVSSARGLRVDARAGVVEFRGDDGQVLARVRRGEILSLDGRTGEVFSGPRRLRTEPAREGLAPSELKNV